jgi:hypothetical protein
MRSILLLMLGVPIPIVILIALFSRTTDPFSQTEETRWTPMISRPNVGYSARHGLGSRSAGWESLPRGQHVGCLAG